MGEVITFQVGSFSNFVGSHFWNIQQEQSNRDAVLTQQQRQDESVLTSGINSTSLWSEHNVKYQTVYRPRLVAVDLEGALGGIHDDLVLGTENQNPTNNQNQSACWNLRKIEQIDPHKFASISKHPFIRTLDNEISSQLKLTANGIQKPILTQRQFNFSSTVRYFTDFFIPEWEPSRHVSLVPDYFYGVNRFDSYAEGLQLTHNEEPGSFWDTLVDQFRHQFELSDQIGALHLLVDWNSGFGGIGSGVVEWLVENVPRTPIVVYANQPYEEIMAEKSNQWTGSYRRVGGGLFVKTCMDELCHGWNSLTLSDLNLSSSNSVKRVSPDQSLSLGNLDFKSLYESSALPGLSLDLLSMRYRLEGGKPFAARQLIESIHLTNRFAPFMSLHVGCPIIPDLLQLRRKSSVETHSLSLIERLWDVSTSPTSQPSRVPNSGMHASLHASVSSTRYHDQASLTQYTLGRGLTRDQEISLVSQLLDKDRFLLHPDQVPLPLTFPQFNKDPDSSEQVDISALLCARSMSQPSSCKVLCKLRDCIDRVNRFGRSAALESHDSLFERGSLLDLSSQFTELFHSDDSPLDVAD